MLKFPDETTKSMFVFDSSLTDPLAVDLDQDVEIPAKHEVLQAAQIKKNIIAENVLEPNMSLTGRGVLVARVFVQPKGQRVPIQIINPGVEPVKLYKGMKVGDLQQVDVEMKDPLFEPEDHICTSQDESNFKFNHLKPDEKRMKHLLRSHQDIYASSSGEFGLISLAEHKIQTREATPIKQLPRRLPNALRLIVEEQVNEMLEKKVIKPSNSPWSSTIVLVRKKDGTWRFCIDFRELN